MTQPQDRQSGKRSARVTSRQVHCVECGAQPGEDCTGLYFQFIQHRHGVRRLAAREATAAAARVRQVGQQQ